MPNDILTRAIDEICDGTHLTADHTSAALAEIMEGRAEPVQIGAFLIALRAKGETVAELVGLARTMRELSAQVKVNRDDLVDTAGTGGGPTTFNISTTAALIAAGAGCAVAKHGNRSATGLFRSPDLLQALGGCLGPPPPAGPGGAGPAGAAPPARGGGGGSAPAGGGGVSCARRPPTPPPATSCRCARSW